MNRPQVTAIFSLMTVGVLAFAGMIHGCTEGEPLVSDGPAISEGEQLARVHCAACHDYPEPDLLTKRSWGFLLPYMGLRMGLEDFSTLEGTTELELEMINNRKKTVAREGAARETPVVSDEQWVAIRDFYMDNAPESLVAGLERPTVEVGLGGLFEVREHGYAYEEPITSLVHIDEKHRQILLGDTIHQKFTVLDKALEPAMSQLTPAFCWVRADVNDQGVYLLSIGDLMGSASEHRIGDVFYAARRGEAYVSVGVALDNLHRPSDMAFGDFDGDGTNEIVVCNFGFGTGSVDIHKLDINGWQYDTTPYIILANEKGPVDCHVADFNKDGRQDVAVLFGNERENLSIFLNNGDGTFERHYIVNQHSAFGYIGFRWGDFNNDGHLDVWTINGDNVDSDPYNTLKPYHGVRLYLGRGDMTFAESYFYPMYGAYGLEIEDFDLDGDLDLAVMSAIPDFDSERNESFVYLENTGDGGYAAKTIDSPRTDRWLVMDAGDFDGDGDKDIVLGGAFMEMGLAVDNQELMEQMSKQATTLLVLENKTR